MCEKKLFKAFSENCCIRSISISQNYNSAIMELAYMTFSILKSTSKIEIIDITIDGIVRKLITLVNKDRAFLLDSATNFFSQRDVTVMSIGNAVFSTKRDKSGSLIALDDHGARKESVMYFVVSSCIQDRELVHGLEMIMDLVHKSNIDWKKTLGHMYGISKQFPEDSEEREFLRWCKKNFILLGYENSGANSGMLRSRFWNHGAPECKGEGIVISHSDVLSPVHKSCNLEVISVNVASVRCVFVGMFTSVVEMQDPTSIPMLRSKIEYVQKESGFMPGEHNYKEVTSILQDMPKSELFQNSAEELKDMAMQVLSVHSSAKSFIHHEKSNLMTSILICTDKPESQMIRNIGRYLKVDLSLEIAHEQISFKNSGISYVRFVVFGALDVPIEALSATLDRIALSWSNRLKSCLTENASRVNTKYEFSMGYQVLFSPEEACLDIEKLEQCKKALQCRITHKDGKFQLKIYVAEAGYFEELMMVLQHMQLRVLRYNRYDVAIRDTGEKLRIHYLSLSEKVRDDEDAVKNLEFTLQRIHSNEISNDKLNALVLRSRLSATEVNLVRVFVQYMKQLKYEYRPGYVQDVLVGNPNMVEHLVELFHERFNPKLETRDTESTIGIIDEKINDIESLTECRIFSALQMVMMAVDRTSFYLTDRSYVSLKIDTSKIEFAPKPVPYREVYVYSNDFEGIHLRGGAIARGGLRWSDRHEDFRTEVLSLMKAQVTKNTVIVPTGSKGGFIVKRKLNDRSEYMQFGQECYKNFLRGILDLTCNRKGRMVLRPKNVVCYDEKDPYLVVAADKGTATFSDLANRVSIEYGFWLGDAFASGGSEGYDHKKMGITAKGAWCSTVHHFQGMGMDITNTPFTVVGIGDMSGDVFGNGMLLSDKIQLVMAFNHLHIFVDPNPDIDISFKERQRMFKLPKSTWNDYDKSKISKGGMVFDRGVKSITITPEIQERFCTKQAQWTPDEFIHHVLKSEIDLIFNGGIGTFVKSSKESNASTADQSNDIARVNGNEIRAKMIVEGGNLGCTQLGRIEYARDGGLINTDFIDNSSGVSCSDREVNIKILLNALVHKGELSLEKRNEILHSMTSEVEELVLYDNVLQNKTLDMMQAQAKAKFDNNRKLIRNLEDAGLLDREVEFLPGETELDQMQSGNITLSRPELSVMMSYSKIWLFNKIIGSAVADDPYFEQFLCQYFPKYIRDNYPNEIKQHPLKREIIATYIANSSMNRIGCTLFNMINKNAGMPECDIARAYFITIEAFGIRKIWHDIEHVRESNPDINKTIELQLFRNVQSFIGWGIFWFFANEKSGMNIIGTVEKYNKQIVSLCQNIHTRIGSELLKVYDEKYQVFIEDGVSDIIAKDVASFMIVGATLDIIKIHKKLTKQDIASIEREYYEIGDELSIDWLINSSFKIKPSNLWEKMNIRNLRDGLHDLQREATCIVLKNNTRDRSAIFDDLSIKRYRSMIMEIQSSKSQDFHMLNAAQAALSNLLL